MATDSRLENNGCDNLLSDASVYLLSLSGSSSAMTDERNEQKHKQVLALLLEMNRSRWDKPTDPQGSGLRVNTPSAHLCVVLTNCAARPKGSTEWHARH